MPKSTLVILATDSLPGTNDLLEAKRIVLVRTRQGGEYAEMTELLRSGDFDFTTVWIEGLPALLNIEAQDLLRRAVRASFPRPEPTVLPFPALKEKAPLEPREASL